MKLITILLALSLSLSVFAGGKIIGADVKTSAELATAGGTDADMIKDSQIYLSTGLAKTLGAAITAQDLVKNLGSLSFLSNTNKVTTFQGSGSATGSVTYTLPIADGTSGQILSTNASGVLSWVTDSTTDTTKATKALDNLASVAINTTLASDTNNTDDLGTTAIGWKEGFINKISMDSNAQTTSLQGSASASASVTYSLPVADGSSGYVLSTNGSGVMSWIAQGSGANAALSNLASVAINTTLVSDTDNTDDLGTSSNSWKDVYARTLKLDGATSGTATISAPAAAGTASFVVPPDNGSSTNILQTDGSGNTSWVAKPTSAVATTETKNNALNVCLSSSDSSNYRSMSGAISLADGNYLVNIAITYNQSSAPTPVALWAWVSDSNTANSTVSQVGSTPGSFPITYNSGQFATLVNGAGITGTPTYLTVSGGPKNYYCRGFLQFTGGSGISVCCGISAIKLP